MSDTIDINGELHLIGNTECHEGWCGYSDGYPKRCVCGGLIHADIGGVNNEFAYWLDEKCDRCGDMFEERADTPK